MKIYISGAITSDQTNCRQNFRQAEEKLISFGNEVINPERMLSELATVLSYDELMGICRKLIQYSNAVYMLSNHEKSKGATIEKEYAQSLNIPIYYADRKEIPMDAKGFLKAKADMCEAFRDNKKVCPIAVAIHASKRHVGKVENYCKWCNEECYLNPQKTINKVALYAYGHKEE